MKIKSLFCLLFAGAALIAVTGYGEEGQTEGTSASSAAQDASSRGLSPVAAVLEKSPTFNAQPNLEAEYYVYLVSASWCPPCRAEMPKIASLYNQMKDDGVEIVLVSGDATQEKAQDYLAEFKATFPAIMPGRKGMTELPGYTSPSTIPHAIIVTKEGKVVKQGHGSIVLQYREIISQYERQE